jgi:endonuclease YncB( thermonuclease family)
MIGLYITLVVLIPLSTSIDQAADVIAGRASVIDGDTIEIRGERIRFFGIDAPEMGQQCTDGEGCSSAAARRRHLY